MFNTLLKKNLDIFGIEETEYQEFLDSINDKFNLSPGDESLESKVVKIDNEFLLGLKDKDLYSFKIMY